MRFLRQTIREIDPYSTLCFGEKWSFLLLVALSGLSYRVFVSERAEPWKTSWLNRWIKRLIMRKAEGVIVQSQSAQELYHSLFPEKSIYKINDPFVQNGNFTSIRKEKVVLAVGPLGPNNRLDQLIRQFRNVRMPGWKLVITGGDSFLQHYVDKLKETIRDLQADDYVILAGSRIDMNYYYGMSSVFAHVSTSAGSSYALGEAMSAGIPVVGFNSGTRGDNMVEHGSSGLLAPSGDFHTIGLYLRQLMNYPGLGNKMGFYARQKMQQYKPMDIGESYYKCLVLDKSLLS
jgi:glycosyltransferase involved in cell wall biosynthesis